MEKITELLSIKVTTEDGKYLGRVEDVRSEGDPEHGLVNEERMIDQVLVRKRGLLSFLGLDTSGVKTISSKKIKKFSRGGVVVDEKA